MKQERTNKPKFDKKRVSFKNKGNNTKPGQKPFSKTAKQSTAFDSKPGTTTVYIGNLRFNKTEGKVKKMFMKYGKVGHVTVVNHAGTNKSKGIAFVQMYNATHAKAAIEDLNGKEVDGRTLKVSIAKERNPEKLIPREKKTKEKDEEKSVISMDPKKQTRRRDRGGLKALFNHLKR